MSIKISFLKHKKEESFSNTVQSALYEPDYIPYACHYNADTLLTKNGELMQTIKIIGFNFESVGSEMIDLRETIREALREGLIDTSYAVWFHTIRRRKNIATDGVYQECFSRQLHDAWNQQNDWKRKYVNELFITVVKDGETGNIATPARFMRSLFIARDIVAREDYLQKIHEELNKATNSILRKLQTYGARKLSVVQEDGIYNSEPLRFLGKILKLQEKEVALSETDLSQALATHKVQFGHDALEVKSSDESRRFGAILTIKEYHELSLMAIDRFLQLPEEFIITQTMDFISATKAVKSFSYQHQMMQISKDSKLTRLSGLDDIMQSVTGNPTDFCEQQITIFLISDDLKHLGRYMENTIDALSSLGILVMREDLRLEEAYWSQLPANFSFLRRLKPLNTSRIGGFANLSNYPAGKASGNHWGPAVTVFNTAAQTPYFFNFHHNNIGHTTLIGPAGSEKNILLNFLLSETRKFNPKLFFFDFEQRSEIFIRALGGSYHTLNPQQSSVGMNPLQLEPTQANRNFIHLWLTALLQLDDSSDLTQEQESQINVCLQKLYELPQEHRNLAIFGKLLSQTEPSLALRLVPWYEGSHAGIFGHANDELSFDKLVHGFEMGDIVKDWYSIPAVMLYLIHRIMLSLDGQPAIIAIDEAWNLLDNPYLGPRLKGWLDTVTARNGIVILATENFGTASQSPINQEISGKISTQIYFPDSNPSKAYQHVFHLNDNEFELLSIMSPREGHFLLKKKEEAIIGQLNLYGMEQISDVLIATSYTRAIMQSAIEEHGDNPDNWLPAYYERLRSEHA